MLKHYDVPYYILYFSNLWYAMLKRSLAASLPLMKSQLHLSYHDIGQCSALFSIFYGSFKLVGGIISDLLPVYQVYSIGILLGSVINLLIPVFAAG
jgi:sugar phosphate permease